MKKSLLLAGIVSLTMISCGEKEETADHQENDQKTQEACNYAIDASSLSFQWTAFKFSDTTAVPGGFDSILVTQENLAENIKDAANGTSFEIFTNSVISNNLDREQKLRDHFFGNMFEGLTITGKINSVQEDGSGTVMINMNGIAIDAPFDWEITDEKTFALNTSLDVTSWNGQSQLDSLNHHCELLHTGPDGISILYPRVDIAVSADFIKECK